MRNGQNWADEIQDEGSIYCYCRKGLHTSAWHLRVDLVRPRITFYKDCLILTIDATDTVGRLPVEYSISCKF